jgi:endonuclease-3 related protein
LSPSKNKLAERENLLKIYQQLLDHFGSPGWWPAKTPFEVIVGAILTQSVSWRNVQQAIARLSETGVLDPVAMRELPQEKLEDLIHSTRYYRMKAKKLKAFLDFIHEEYHDNLEELANQPSDKLRQELLTIYGLGAETVDSILLYAFEIPIFVVDGYTRRIFSRLGYWEPKISYDRMQKYFQGHLAAESQLYNEYHALIVSLGHSYCRQIPRCKSCPISSLCHWEGKEDKICPSEPSGQ